MQLHVTGAFKLFVDNFIHFGAGVDKRSSDNGQATTLFHVTCSTEETLRTVQGVGIHTTGQYFTGSGNHGVIRTRQTGDGVEQNDNVFLVLNQAFRLLNHHFRNLNVTRCRFVEGGSDNFTFNQTLHLGHFFRAFVDEQNHQYAIRVVVGNALRNILQQHRFTGFRRCNNQTTLTAANWRSQVQDTCRQIFGRTVTPFHAQARVRVQRR